jgi:hypothetical protein
MNLGTFKSDLLGHFATKWMFPRSLSEKERLEFIDDKIVRLENKLKELQKENNQLKCSKKDLDEENTKLKEALDRFENPN